MVIIGVCGASGSGKSTLAKALYERLDDCLLLRQDSYYRNHPDMTFEERCEINYDEPNAFDHAELYADLTALREGRSITAKDYDFPNHCRADRDEMLEPKKVVILEGIHTFFDERVRDICDLKIYLQVDPDVCILRRVKRDIRDRGRSVESVQKQYLETVKPMFEKYIRNYADYADIIVAHGGKNAKVVDIIAHYINTAL